MNDPIAILTADHRQVEQLFERIEKAEGEERARLVAELESSLRLHMDIEESIVYPIVASQVDEEDAEEANVEHDLAREGLDKLRQLLDQPGFGAALDMVKAGVHHHVEEEEGEIFPQLEGKLDDDKREELGDAVAEAKASGAPKGERAESSDGSGDEPTKQELLEEARRRDIPGRSSMTKDELQKALGQG